MSVVDDAEWSHLTNLSRQVLSRVVAGVLNPAIAIEAQSKEIVVLADDLAGGTRKVQREGRHVSTQVVDVEDQILGQIHTVAPYHPSNAQRRQAKLVPRRVDRFDSRQPEIPGESGVAKRR